MYNLKMAIIKRRNIVVIPYVENTLYSTNKYSCVRPVHTLYISYLRKAMKEQFIVNGMRTGNMRQVPLGNLRIEGKTVVIMETELETV